LADLEHLGEVYPFGYAQSRGDWLGSGLTFELSGAAAIVGAGHFIPPASARATS
jgi:hypothetical protein